MSTIELYFPYPLTVVLGPNRAITVEPGDVITVDRAVAETLLKRGGIVRATPERAALSRVEPAKREMAAAAVAKISPAPNPEMFIPHPKWRARRASATDRETPA